MFLQSVSSLACGMCCSSTDNYLSCHVIFLCTIIRVAAHMLRLTPLHGHATCALYAAGVGGVSGGVYVGDATPFT